MLRSLHMKLVMIMVLLILSLMTVVGAFLINSVMAFYLEDFYVQMQTVFERKDLIVDLSTKSEGEENSAEMILDVLSAFSGELGVNGSSRKLYILDESGNCLTGSDGAQSVVPDYSHNLTSVLGGSSVGDDSSVAADFMDLAVAIERGGQGYIVYIRDDKSTVSSLIDQMFVLIMEALAFGLVISILLSFLLSKTMITPIQRLTEGALRVAKGDFSRKIEVASRDEIGVLTDTFNNMAGQMEDTLEQVENERNKLNTLFLHMTDGVVAFSREGAVIHVNPAASEMLGCVIAPETTYEQLFGDIAPLNSVLYAPDYLQGERQVADRYLELLLAPFDRERQSGALVVIHDVTGQRKNEQMRREFVANVSHELRTPLTNIHSYAETLSNGAGDIAPDVEKRFLGVILNESERMAHIVQDLLTLSRFDSGREDLKLTQFSLEKMVQDVYSAVYMDARRHQHTINVKLEPNLPNIVADRDRIVQVLMNVVSNAIKYTPDGGEITIFAGRKEQRVWLVVTDNGIGIPPEDRKRIFERFYRVDKARSRQSGGTGLGLSIAREIVERHQGTLDLVDKAGAGTAVRLELNIEGPAHG